VLAFVHEAAEILSTPEARELAFAAREIACQEACGWAFSPTRDHHGHERFGQGFGVEGF